MASRIGVRRALTWIAAIVLVFVSGAAPKAREFRSLEIESLRVTIDTDWVSRGAPGYLPVRFEITNLGDARVIEIVGQGSRMFRVYPRTPAAAHRPGGVSSSTVSQTLRLRRGDRVRFTMAMPVFGDSETYVFELRENSRTLERFSYVGIQSATPFTDVPVLFVADASTPFGSNVTNLLRIFGGRTIGSFGGLAPGSTAPGVTTSRPVGRLPVLDYVLEPARLPVNWMGFTSVRAVAIGKTEWGFLTDPQKSALITWIACGGELILVDGQAADVLPAMPTAPATAPDRVVGRYFFGRVHALTLAALESTGLPDTLKAMDGSRSRAWSLPVNGALDWGTIEARGFRLPIPGIEGVPARAYLSILVLFSVIIGPASFWFLWRRRQRVLLVLTAPIISIVFIVLLAGYAVVGEGFGVYGRAATFTILDEAAKQAATRAAVSMYAAGMTPSGGLRFGRDVAVFPIGPLGNGTRERLTLDLSEAQRYSGGVVQARSPTNIEEITFRPARERLTFTRGADGISVVNGLDATLTHLIYRDGETAYRLSGPLAPGGRQTLTTGDIDAGLIVPEKLTAGGTGKFIDLVKQQPAGTYLAVLDRSPFWETGVPELRERGSFHLVLGYPEGQASRPATVNK